MFKVKFYANGEWTTPATLTRDDGTTYPNMFFSESYCREVAVRLYGTNGGVDAR